MQRRLSESLESQTHSKPISHLVDENVVAAGQNKGELSHKQPVCE